MIKMGFDESESIADGIIIDMDEKLSKLSPPQRKKVIEVLDNEGFSLS